MYNLFHCRNFALHVLSSKTVCNKLIYLFNLVCCSISLFYPECGLLCIYTGRRGLNDFGFHGLVFHCSWRQSTSFLQTCFFFFFWSLFSLQDSSYAIGPFGLMSQFTEILYTYLDFPFPRLQNTYLSLTCLP